MALHNTHSQSGFALLLSLMVVSVVVSVGLSILDLSIKQLRLSTNSRDSEIAFHASGAGLGCARYHRTTQGSAMETGIAITASCFGVSMTPTITPIVVASGAARVYAMEATWGSVGSERCSQMKTLVITSDVAATTTISGAVIAAELPGYPYVDKKCGPGGRCTVISVQGYSQSCANVAANQVGIVEREVLLEL